MDPRIYADGYLSKRHFVFPPLRSPVAHFTCHFLLISFCSGRPSTASSPDATKDESHNAHTVREDNGKPTVMGNTETPNAERSIEDPHNSVRRNVDKAVPKWFKLGTF